MKTDSTKTAAAERKLVLCPDARTTTSRLPSMPAPRDSSFDSMTTLFLVFIVGLAAVVTLTGPIVRAAMHG